MPAYLRDLLRTLCNITGECSSNFPTIESYCALPNGLGVPSYGVKSIDNTTHPAVLGHPALYLSVYFCLFYPGSFQLLQCSSCLFSLYVQRTTFLTVTYNCHKTFPRNCCLVNLAVHVKYKQEITSAMFTHLFSRLIYLFICPLIEIMGLVC